MAHMAWLAAFGLDFHEINEPYIRFELLWQGYFVNTAINEPYISSPDLQPALKFFNRYVTSKRLEYARQGQKGVSSNKSSRKLFRTNSFVQWWILLLETGVGLQRHRCLPRGDLREGTLRQGTSSHHQKDDLDLGF